MKIVEVKIEHIYDDMPDTSFFGSYTDRRPPQGDINRGNAFEKQHHPGRNEYKYFSCVGVDSVEGERAALSKMGMSKGDAEFYARRMMRNNYERMEGLCKGEWYFIGVKAIVTIEYDSPFGLRTETIEDSLWGIEAGTQYLSYYKRPLYFDVLIYPIKQRQHYLKHHRESEWVKECEDEVLSIVRAEVEKMTKGFDVDVDAAFAEVIEADEVIYM